MADPVEKDWLLKFLNEFTSMSEEQRDAAIDALSAADRAALVALAEARAATAEADLVGVLDAGHAGLDKLYEMQQPADLFAVIDLAARQYPEILVEALFAAVIMHRRPDRQAPAAIVALREQWHWHVHDQLEAAEREDGD
jgi:hypothetical protein